MKFPGNRARAEQFAAESHQDTIVANINSLVRHATPDPVMLDGGPSFPVVIRDFSLEIVQPNDEPVVTSTVSTNGQHLIAEPPPLRADDGGVLRVGSSRVSLDLVVEQYENGMTPEGMVRAYDTLQLADVYAVIAYYLRHHGDVQAYLKRRGEETAALRAKIEAEQPRVGRDELLARRNLREAAHAPAGQ